LWCSRHANQADAKGYSLVELLVAMGITLSVVASTLTIVSGLQQGFGTEGERADGQQRLRVATNAISRDLSRAGAGSSQGAHSGPLGFSVATVFPFRQGSVRPDSPGTARTDVLTAAYVPAQTAAQTTIRLAMTATSGTAFINLDPGCPPVEPACGFSAGMDVMVYDDTGSYDTFRVLATQPGSLQLQHTMADTPQSYAAEARIVEASSHTYYLKADPATDTFQLMHYDGVASDAAVVDHVVGLVFEYFGEPAPPRLVRPVTDPTGPWTTYGPKPPQPGVQSTAYPAGENCVFQTDPSGTQQVPRLATLGDGVGTTLVKLTMAQLGDGPWCPDAVNAHRYDADLLRIRRISVTVRLEAALSALRGPAGSLFTRGGTARAAGRWLPDQEVRFDVAPRNLNIGR
jgi:Tfp pilus assembly protein PilW